MKQSKKHVRSSKLYHRPSQADHWIFYYLTGELQKQVSDLLRLMCEEQQKTQVAYARANGVLPAS